MFISSWLSTLMENKNGSPGLGAASCMQQYAYPDQAIGFSCGNGTRFERMRGIIHDFLRYNLRMQYDLGKVLKMVLPASDVEMLNLIARVAEAQGASLYAVGGLPRDLALGRIPSDFDLVVEGSAIALARALVREYGGTVTGHARFGTAQWHVEQSRTAWGLNALSEDKLKHGRQIDLVSARRESYSRPAALPEIAPGSIEDDLRRRDFTINTLALRLDGPHYGETLDPLGARRDLDRRLIRTLHEESFQDDPTRMLRAIRYEQRLDFRIDPGTLRQIPEGLRWLRQVSAHRVRQELDSALQQERAAQMIHRMGKLGLLRAIHPSLPFDGACVRRLRVSPQGGNDHPHAAAQIADGELRWLSWFLDLSSAQIRSVRRRLLFDTRLTTQMLAASRLWHGKEALAGLRPSQLTRRLDKVPEGSIRAVERALSKGKSKTMLGEYLATWRIQRPMTTGADLGRRGIAPGPAYRRILQRLRAGWIDGTIRNAEQEQLALESLIKRSRSRGATAAGGPRASRRKRA
jgi:tRNA nucleotidyltransferase (CCA-adding enzyme)